MVKKVGLYIQKKYMQNAFKALFPYPHLSYANIVNGSLEVIVFVT